MEVALTKGSSLKPGVNKTTAKSVPAFLNKLFSMVNDPDTDDYIHWSKDGDSFLIPSADKFAKEVLPRFFKHSNFGSFVRQCNMYGFHKVPSLQQGALKAEEEGLELLEFSNTNFVQGQPDLLCLIRRQKARAEPVSAESGALDLPLLLTDLAAIRKHQTAISADLKTLQQSNHALWQEAIQSRERHARQQETINKILRFLATVFGGQVVGAEGDSPPGNSGVVVEEDSNGSGNASPSGANEGGENGAVGGKGKGKGTDPGRVVVPKLKSRLLLEDVKGRQQARAKERKSMPSASSSNRGNVTAEDDEADDDDIEEIPLLREVDDLPSISSASHYTSIPSLSRSQSSSQALSLSSKNSDSSRFTTIPSPNATTSGSESRPVVSSVPANTTTNNNSNNFHFSPEMNGLFGGNNSSSTQAAFELFLQSQQQSQQKQHQSNDTSQSSASPSISGTLNPAAIDAALSSFPRTPGGNNIDFSRALLPSPSVSNAPTSNPLDLLVGGGSTPGALFNPNDFSAEYQSAINDTTQAIEDVTNEKADIDARTSALESAIAKLMQNLPEETREQLSHQSGQGADGVASTTGTPGNSWMNPNGDLDIDKFLSQYETGITSGATPIDYSMYFDPDASGAASSPAGMNGHRASSQFEVLSPSVDDDEDEDEDVDDLLHDEDRLDAESSKTSNGGDDIDDDDEGDDDKEDDEFMPNRRTGPKAATANRKTALPKAAAKKLSPASKTTVASKKRKSDVIDEASPEVMTPGGTVASSVRKTRARR